MSRLALDTKGYQIPRVTSVAKREPIRMFLTQIILMGDSSAQPDEIAKLAEAVSFAILLTELGELERCCRRDPSVLTR